MYVCTNIRTYVHTYINTFAECCEFYVRTYVCCTYVRTYIYVCTCIHLICLGCLGKNIGILYKNVKSYRRETKSLKRSSLQLKRNTRNLKVCTYVCTYMHTYVRMWIRICVCMYVRTYVYIHICTNMHHIYSHLSLIALYVHTYVHVVHISGMVFVQNACTYVHWLFPIHTSVNHCSSKAALTKLIATANTELIAHGTCYIIAEVRTYVRTYLLRSCSGYTYRHLCLIDTLGFALGIIQAKVSVVYTPYSFSRGTYFSYYMCICAVSNLHMYVRMLVPFTKIISVLNIRRS